MTESTNEKLKSASQTLTNNKTLLYLIGFLGVFLIFLGIVVIAGNADKQANWLVAFGTIILAIATYTSIISGREQENRHRQESLNREYRERKERLLNTVAEWGIDVSKCSMDFDAPLESYMNKSDTEAINKMNLNSLIRYGKVFVRRMYVSSIARELGDEDLVKEIDEAVSNLNIVLFLQAKEVDMESPLDLEDFDANVREELGGMVKSISENPAALDYLSSLHADKLDLSVNALLSRIGHLLASN